MTKVFCRKANFYKFKRQWVEDGKFFLPDLMPTPYRIKDETRKKIYVLTNILSEEGFNKYLKRQDIFDIDVVLDYGSIYLNVSKVRILRKYAVRVVNISGYALEQAIDKVKYLSTIQENIAQKKTALIETYKPKNVKVDLKYIQTSDKLKIIIFSLVLFTIDKLKEEAIKNEEIEISSNKFFYLFYLAFGTLGEFTPLNTGFKDIIDKLDKGYVKIVKKTKSNESQTKEIILDTFLGEILSNFANTFNTTFTEKEKEILRGVLLFAIGLFTLSYITHFIDFKSFSKKHFMEDLLRISLKKENGVWMAKVGNKNFYFKECDEGALDKMRSMGGDQVIYLEHNGNLVTADYFKSKPATTSEIRFWFYLTLKWGEVLEETRFDLHTPVAFMWAMKVLDFLTGWKLKKDYLYRLAASFLKSYIRAT